MPAEPLAPEVFKRTQDELRDRGEKKDLCGECGCERNQHFPKDFFMYAKSGFSSGQAIAIPNLAPTHCDCKYCLCSCVKFVEPTANQKFRRCFGIKE